MWCWRLVASGMWEKEMMSKGIILNWFGGNDFICFIRLKVVVRFCTFLVRGRCIDNKRKII